MQRPGKGLIGSSQRRVDALSKAYGEHIFPSDHAMEGMLWLSIVRSSRPHAKIRKIDTSPALAKEGVVRVLTAGDIPGSKRFGLIAADQPILSDEIVRYHGEPIAIVAAVSDEIARSARDAVRVEYEDLPIIDDARTAERGPPLHGSSNVCSDLRIGHGDTNETFTNSALKFEIEYTTNRQEHAFLETEAGTAWFDEGGILTVSVGGQNPFHDRRQICEALNLPHDRVRVLNPMMGGAFGGKEDCNVQIPLALVTYLTGQPCRLMFDRSESIASSVKRHQFAVKYQMGTTADGLLMALDAELLVDAGAYMTLSPAVAGQAAEHASGPYKIEACAVRSKSVFTNNGNASAFRGFGVPQTTIGIEQLMDEVARKLNLSPFEVRRKNLLRKGDVAGGGFVMNSNTTLHRLLDEAERGALWTGRDRFRLAAHPWTRRGVGVCAIWQGYGLGGRLESGSTVHLSLTQGGKYRLKVGTPDIGSGNVTAFLQIAAEGLNASFEQLEYIAGDTRGPESGSTHASRTIFTVGNAVAQAAANLRSKIIDAAARIYGGLGWSLQGDIVVCESDRHSLAEIGGKFGEILEVHHYAPVMPKEVALGVPHISYAYAVQVMGVEVDLLTGQVVVLEVENYVDTGRTINPVGVTAQCEGAFAQGLGYALYENAIYDRATMKNPTFSNYIMPTTMDMPPKLSTFIFETPDPANPLAVRGIAELGLTPVAASTGNAICDAIGVRFSQFPILPEMVLAAVYAKKEAA